MSRRSLQIVAEEKKKADIQRKLEKLASQLQRVNESLAQKAAARNEYDVTIQETEAGQRARTNSIRVRSVPRARTACASRFPRLLTPALCASRSRLAHTSPLLRLGIRTNPAYMKILESSQTLLHVLKRETNSLVKTKKTSGEQMQQHQQTQQSYGASSSSGGYAVATRTK